MGVFLISFFIVLYKKHKVCFIIGKIINNSRNPSANIQEGQQRGLALGTGQGGRRQTGSGAGTDVSVMGSTPGRLLGAVKITNGRAESNSNKRR